jgi:hypothetical protein
VRGDQPRCCVITPGGVFPDYALPDHTGTVRPFGELQGRDPLIHRPNRHSPHAEAAAPRLCLSGDVIDYRKRTRTDRTGWPPVVTAGRCRLVS